MKSRRQSSGGSAGEGNTHSSGGGGGCKMERKDVEKNRRLHMKGLCLKLSSLLPPAAKHASLLAAAAPASCSNPNKDTVTQLDHLENAAAYIKQLKGRIEELKRRKGSSGGDGSCNKQRVEVTTVGVRMPVIEVRYQDGTLDVVLISEAGRPFKLHEVITVLEQEGAEVVSASFSVIGDKIFYTIHSQAVSSRIGLEAARVSERLQDLLQDD
ncbi:hypothetical protein EJB05_31960, partial [Eragrostis curvula]